MNELGQLQILNDMIAQTIDVINRRAALSQTPWQTPWSIPGSAGSFLSHSPQIVPSQLAAMNPFAAPVVPSLPYTAVPVGLSHTGLYPRNGYAPFPGVATPFSTAPIGLSHSGFDARFAYPGVNQVPSVGLSHTGLDPRAAYSLSAMPFQVNPWTPVVGFGQRFSAF